MICKILLITLLVGPLSGAEYCAFHIVVEDPRGQSRGLSIPVDVRDAGGRIVAHSITRDGKSDVCDVGFGTFDIEFASKSCGEVIVRRLTATLGEDQTIKAVLNRCLEPPWIPPTSCLVLLRARNAEDAPLQQAAVEIDGHPTHLRTDSLGRVVLAMEFGQTSTITLSSKTSNSAADVRVSCTKDEPRIERTLTLRPR
jgi:hypothetical protein